MPDRAAGIRRSAAHLAGAGWPAEGKRIIGWRRQARSAAESEEGPGMAGLCLDELGLDELAARPKMRA